MAKRVTRTLIQMISSYNGSHQTNWDIFFIRNFVMLLVRLYTDRQEKPLPNYSAVENLLTLFKGWSWIR